MKRLAEEEKQNSNTNNTTKLRLIEWVFNNETNKPTTLSLTGVAVCYNEEPPLLKHSSPVISIFHPPALG
jgi:hypothetical protein